jgi:dihydrofolate synthase/folylpolyglutamate synthase
MIDISRQSTAKQPLAPHKQRSYNEVIEYLDQHWLVAPVKSLDRIKKLDTALGSPAQKVNAILVAGTNGKSLTINFATKLLRFEGLKVGAFYDPSILTYNEQFTLNQEIISNKAFTEIAQEVINKAETLDLNLHTQELLVMMALVYFKNAQVDVALLEVSSGGTYNPANICHAKIATVTRVTAKDIKTTEEDLNQLAQEIAGIVKQGTILVSGDQNKSRLQLMQEITKQQGGIWAMPIRKLAVLPYPYGSIHGRSAALAERIAQLYLEKFLAKEITLTSDSILVRQKGRRGRPTLEEKRKALESPRLSPEQFWKKELDELSGRFQHLKQEKPTVLLDIADNLDAFNNLLLGIRLLHYQHPLKGLVIIISAAQNTLHNEKFIKLIRYFFKKTSGQLFLCPFQKTLNQPHQASWDVEQVANDMRSMKVKGIIRTCKSFSEALDLAKKSVDERNGLIVITGSLSIVNQYWHEKGIKKL